MKCRILGLLVNTLAGEERYRALNKDNLRIPIEMELSQKAKKNSEFFAELSQSRLNFEHFETRDDPHSFVISAITYSEHVVR